MEPTAPMEPVEPTRTTNGAPPRPPDSGRPWPAIVLGVLAAILAVVLIVVLVNDDDDDDDVTTDSTTSEVEETTTSEAEETTTTAEETTTTEDTSDTTEPGGISDEEAANVVWPDPAGTDLYDDPLDAVAGFAEDLVGFVDPVYGEFQAGDSRSGEVEVRALPDGPVTTVGVRQLSDDSWYVLFAASSEVELTEPAAASAIDTPLQVAGQARAFEGQVRIAVFERGDTDPLGEGFVTAGSGEALEPFTGEVEWDNPGGGWGAVVASTEGGPDGNTWAASAVPVGFIGGD